MSATVIRPAEVGWKAHAALRTAGGMARVFAPLTTSLYLEAGGEILWLGGLDGLRHPRALLAAGNLPGDDRVLAFDLAGIDPWRPRRDVRAGARALRSAACNLCARLGQARPSAGAPRGLGRLLVGDAPDFPLDRAVGLVAEVAAACDRNDAEGAMAAADPLLGLGPGLTPSGDDFVGGVLFARHAVEPPVAAWVRAGAAAVDKARSRTHPISAALLEDMATGEGHECLHDLVEALARGASEKAWQAVQALCRLGESSGWDILAGLLVGLAGAAAISRRGR